ncbi:MAG: phosphatidate cytidylyltransferase [Candidatus Cloacimonetes bacterium]|nr:phosphatidate cytidylyltransferase [Candidatus Cloacimonadota bacterium]
MSELQKRILVSVVGIPLILAALWFGGPWLIILFGVTAFFATAELNKMLENLDLGIHWFWAVINLALYSFSVFFPHLIPPLAWVFFLLVILRALLFWDPERSLSRAAFQVFSAFYLALLPAMCALLGLQKPRLLFVLILLIWLTDTVAYFVGSKWGRRRGIFSVSPNKSLEGFVAGALAPFIVMIILSVTGLYDQDLPVLLLTAFAAGIVGQLGDLAESMLKRSCSVKDSSHLIPGHGGVLDRADSVILAGSFLYSVIILFF